MTNHRFPGPIQFHKQETRKLFVSAGTAYGLIFGLSFALLTWGYDGLLLASSAADLAWAKLFLGLPLAIAIGALTGRLAALSSSTAVFVTLWAMAGALLGIVAGHIPFDGGNLAAWLADRRLWGLGVFPYGHSAAVRTTLIVITGAGLGTAVGFVESLAVQWAWDRATPDDRMSGSSWAVLFVCIPLVLSLAAVVDGLVNHPVRIPQQKVGELIELAVAGAVEKAEARGLDYDAVKPFREMFSERYVVHLVEYDLEALYSAYADVTFDNGFVLRCATVGNTVVYCDDFSRKFAAWMDDLVHAGLYGEYRWLSARWQSLAVDDTVVAWLDAHSDQLSEAYEVNRTGQRGGWVFMSARFDTGFEMTCRFHGIGPVRVDQCVEEETTR